MAAPNRRVFIVLSTVAAAGALAPVVLVGKGITFNSGGISFKDADAMDEMKFDMCGAATVLACLIGRPRSNLRLNLVGLVPTCENMPGAGRSSRGYRDSA